MNALLWRVPNTGIYDHFNKIKQRLNEKLPLLGFQTTKPYFPATHLPVRS